MGKSKTDMKRIIAFEMREQQAQVEWAMKRGVDFPLSILHLHQWHQERRIEYYFWYVKNILTEGNRHNAASKPVKPDKTSPKPWLPWSYFEIERDKQYRLMPKAVMEDAVSKIEGTVNSSVAGCADGYTKISLSPKSQNGKENGNIFAFSRASLIVSPSQKATKCLYIGADEEINATLYFGCDIEDEKKDAGTPPVKGFITVIDEDNHYHAVWLDEFCTLVEVKEETRYIFTYYNEAENVLFIKHLTGLEKADLFSDRDIEADTSGSAPQLLLYKDKFIGLTVRENDVVKLMLKGMSYGEIAKALDIKPISVASYKHRIYRKLKIHTKADLIAFAKNPALLTDTETSVNAIQA